MSAQTPKASDRPSQAGWQRLTDQLPPPADPNDVLWQELEAQFSWYDRAGTRCRVAYQILKVITIVAGATATVLAAVGATPLLTASVAATIVVLEGIQQLFQLHPNWISYRSTAETLRQTAFCYVAEVTPFADAEDRRDSSPP